MSTYASVGPDPFVPPVGGEQRLGQTDSEPAQSADAESDDPDAHRPGDRDPLDGPVDVSSPALPGVVR